MRNVLAEHKVPKSALRPVYILTTNEQNFEWVTAKVDEKRTS